MTKKMGKFTAVVFPSQSLRNLAKHMQKQIRINKPKDTIIQNKH